MKTGPGTYNTTVTRVYYLQHHKPRVITGQVFSERHRKSSRRMHHAMMKGGWQAGGGPQASPIGWALAMCCDQETRQSAAAAVQRLRMVTQHPCNFTSITAPGIMWERTSAGLHTAPSCLPAPLCNCGVLQATVLCPSHCPCTCWAWTSKSDGRLQSTSQQHGTCSWCASEAGEGQGVCCLQQPTLLQLHLHAMIPSRHSSKQAQLKASHGRVVSQHGCCTGSNEAAGVDMQSRGACSTSCCTRSSKAAVVDMQSRVACLYPCHAPCSHPRARWLCKHGVYVCFYVVVLLLFCIIGLPAQWL